jgi:tetratricopeptide (TPR) repeat protein
VKTATGAQNLAAILAEAKDPEGAEKLYREAMGIYEAQYAPNHEKTLDCLWGLATVIWDQHRYTEAEVMIRNLLGRYKLVYGPHHAYVVDSLSVLARILADQGKNEEAEAAFREGITIADESLPATQRERAMLHMRFGVFLRGKERYSESEAELLMAVNRLVDGFGEQHPWTQMAIKELVTLYQATQKPDLAAKWAAKIESKP